MTDSTIQHIATVFPINSEALKPDPQLPRRRSIIRDFGLNTSTHGIPGIARSQSIHNRVFWAIATLIFTGVMIYFVTQAIIAYFSYPTQTSVSFVVQRSQPFPAVSICNYSPLRFDHFIGPFVNYTNSRNVTNTNDTTTMTFEQVAYIRDFIQVILNADQTTYEYFFTLDSMLLLCMYNGQSCNQTDFISFLSATYGLCYTFNAQTKSNQSNIRQTTDGGDIGRFELRLYAQSQQYVPYVSNDVAAGIMIMVHDNTELPLIEAAGIQLAPGRKHKLSYKKRTSEMLPPPYSACTDQISPPMQAMFDRYQGADYAYSPIVCNIICTQTYVYTQCNCVNPLQWTARSILLPGTNQVITAPICNASDPCYVDATNRIANTDSIYNQYCSDCLQSCSTVDFTITPSAVSAPSIEYLYLYENAIYNLGVPLSSNWSDTWYTDIPNNYVAVEVVCETTRIETYSESPSIQPVDLLSNIGGQTGLWIGISFLSIMELVEMAYRLIRYHCYKARKTIRKRIRSRKQGTNKTQMQKNMSSIFA